MVVVVAAVVVEMGNGHTHNKRLQAFFFIFPKFFIKKTLIGQCENNGN